MKKIAYIILGYRGTHIANPTYDKLVDSFHKKGIKTIPVSIDWHSSKKPGKFSDYTNEFLKMYKKSKNTKVIVFGFSYGAMIAYLTAVSIKPDVLMLCSVSPYFVEDYKNLKPSWLKAWKKEHDNTEYLFNSIAPSIVSETYIFVGDKEAGACISRAKNARRKLANSHFLFAKNSKHNIADEGYLEALEKVIIKL